jgi:hypothetical protein
MTRLIRSWPSLSAHEAERPSRIGSCYNVPPMKRIRYGLNFATLTVAVVVFWFAKDVAVFDRVFNFRFFHYGMMGALHAASIVVWLRDHRSTHPIIAFR